MATGDAKTHGALLLVVIFEVWRSLLGGDVGGSGEGDDHREFGRGGGNGRVECDALSFVG